jgi:hypothetical protein
MPAPSSHYAFTKLPVVGLACISAGFPLWSGGELWSKSPALSAACGGYMKSQKTTSKAHSLDSGCSVDRGAKSSPRRRSAILHYGRWLLSPCALPTAFNSPLPWCGVSSVRHVGILFVPTGASQPPPKLPASAIRTAHDKSLAWWRTLGERRLIQRELRVLWVKNSLPISANTPSKTRPSRKTENPDSFFCGTRGPHLFP